MLISGGVRRLCLSNLEIELREATPGALAGLWHGYARFPSWKRAPDLVIEITRLAALPAERLPGPAFPAFERRVTTATTAAATTGATTATATAGAATATATRARATAMAAASATATAMMHVERYDAWGDITCGEQGAVFAHFTVGPSANSLEACLRIAISAALPRTGAFLMHSSAVQLADKALIFSGVSGAGKSTIAELLATRDGLPKLADELLLVQAPQAPGQSWMLHVAPFLGAGGLPHGKAVPLGAVHLLIQGATHQKTALSRHAAVREVMKHLLVYTGLPGTADQTLALVDALCAQVPVYALQFELQTPLRPVLADSRQTS